MKRLFDQNLSPRLVALLQGLYPSSAHVQSLGLDFSADDVLWDHARQSGFVIVTKDADFSSLSVLRGFPPKVVWLLLGNCTTQQVEAALRANHAALLAFEHDPNLGTFGLR